MEHGATLPGMSGTTNVDFTADTWFRYHLSTMWSGGNEPPILRFTDDPAHVSPEPLALGLKVTVQQEASSRVSQRALR